MRAFLDACVLYPTVMREVLLGAASAGLFTPLWSDRVLEEWALAARKIGPEGETIARGDIALLTANWPKATVSGFEGLEKRLWLPDPLDTHVLAAAISESADVIVTMNAKDFPKHILREEGLDRVDPDGMLRGFVDLNRAAMEKAVAKVHSQAEALSGEVWDLRKLLKKARLPRLGKALGM